MNNRKAKNFNLIQMMFFSRTDRNEGGYAFPANNSKSEKIGNGLWSELNPLYFQSIDERIEKLFTNGFVIAGHPTWFSSQKIDLTWAKHILRHIMARYGAFNVVWSLTGEYQFSRNESNGSLNLSEWKRLGSFAQNHNPYGHPVTIHPTLGAPNYMTVYHSDRYPDPELAIDDYSSSGEFHTEAWLDINWIQSWVFVEDVSESVDTDYNKTPAKPVIMAEPAYEHSKPDSYYHQNYQVINENLTRLQAWSAFLCGATGFTYGANSIWQFYDKDAVPDEPGFYIDGVKWRTRMNSPGAAGMRHIRAFFESADFNWENLAPRRKWLKVNGKAPNADEPMWPSSTDFSPPHCAAVYGKTYVIYIPAGNDGNTIEITNLNNQTFDARWYDPRNGTYTPTNGPGGVGSWKLPARPSNEDWVLRLTSNGSANKPPEVSITSPGNGALNAASSMYPVPKRGTMSAKRFPAALTPSIPRKFM